RDVLRHRIVLSYEALAEDLSPDDVLSPIIAAVPIPTGPLRERPVPAAPSTTASGGTGGWYDTTAGSAWARPRD
ncbi:MAG: ATPase, partial [Terracoccus sp.]